MVNEVNKPTDDNNAALSLRLAESNRQLQEMQEEHRQLLQEMETLRLRAAQLSRLNAQQQQHRQRHHQQHQQQHQQQPQSQEESTQDNNNNTTVESAQQAPSTIIEKKENDPVSEPTVAPTQQQDTEVSTSAAESTESNADAEDSEDNAETASYLQEKLAEIARLKSQFNRVQNMINTTTLIEQHIAAKESAKNQNTTAPISANPVEIAPIAAPAPVTTVVGNNSENEELLATMLNMFTDFTSDLRGQAESLRAERDRIKALKEEIISKRQS